MKIFLSLVCAAAFLAHMADAQTSSTTTTTTSESKGTITEFTPGKSIVLTSEGKPIRYEMSEGVKYVTSSGKAIDASKIRKNAKARVHYVPGGRKMIDSVIVED
jgi:hypothetical protein